MIAKACKLACFMILLFPFSFIGCAEKGPSLGQVSGKVTYKGKPLDRALVVFVPDDTKKTLGPRSSGKTDTDGRFTLQTDKFGPGAVIGHHRISISDLSTYGDTYKTGHQWDAESEKLAKLRFPTKFSLPQQSGIEKEVKAGQQEIDIEFP